MKRVTEYPDTLVFEYGDPIPSLIELDKALQRLGLEIAILDDGCSDIRYQIVRKV